MKIQFNQKTSDQLTFQEYIQKRVSAKQGYTGFLMALLPIGTLLFNIIIIHNNAVTLINGAVALGALFWLVKPLFQDSSNFGKYLKLAFPFFENNTDVEIDFNEHDILIKTESMTSNIKYSLVKEIVQTSNHIFVILTNCNGIIIPKRTINDNSITELMDFLQQKLK